jgi:hypothetical protein
LFCFKRTGTIYTVFKVMATGAELDRIYKTPRKHTGIDHEENRFPGRGGKAGMTDGKWRPRHVNFPFGRNFFWHMNCNLSRHG